MKMIETLTEDWPYILLITFLILSAFVYGKYQDSKLMILENSCNDEADNCVGSIHTHAGFKMFVGDRELELYKPENFEKDECTHFHEGLKDIIHIHCPGATIGDFLNSINTTLVGNFLIMVNEHSAYLDYVIQDIDRILITDTDNYNLILVQYNSIERSMSKMYDK